jgi:type VI secretion system protein ImpK
MNRITEVTRECFDAIIQVRRVDAAGLPQPDVLHRQLRAFVDRMFTRAAQAGLGRDDVDDIAYAIVALADETVASRSEALGEFWAGHSLQLQYFRESVAGEAFFTRLEQIRKDPRRREVLQVYALALSLGFQGRYRVRGGELELLTLIEEVQRELGRARRYDSEVLSPRGERPEDGRAVGRRSGPAMWIALGALTFVLVLYVGLRVWLGFSADSVEQIARAAVST